MKSSLNLTLYLCYFLRLNDKEYRKELLETQKAYKNLYSSANIDNKNEPKEKNNCTEHKEKQLKNRHERLSELKEKNEEITEEIIKELNKKELVNPEEESGLGFELEILLNYLDKMYFILSVGLELAETLKNITLKKLEDKVKSAGAIAASQINKQIEEIKKQSPLQFLESPQGKVLKDALAKHGLSEVALTSKKKELMKERAERRKAEREEFGIKVNEFDEEDILKMEIDLATFVMIEQKDIKNNYREYAREKLVEQIYKNKKN